MSNDPVYSKQVLDNLKDGCEKVKTIFNNVETQRKQQQEFINKISNFDKEFSTMLDNMSKNLVLKKSPITYILSAWYFDAFKNLLCNFGEYCYLYLLEGLVIYFDLGKLSRILRKFIILL